jgi:hypothetical protein
MPHKNRMPGVIFVILLATSPLLTGQAAEPHSLITPTTYHVSRTFLLGDRAGAGAGANLSVDATDGKLYVPRGLDMIVVDGDTGRRIGRIPKPDRPGNALLGVAIAADLKRGFIATNGGHLTAFNTTTLETQDVPLQNAHFVIYDRASKRVFPMGEDEAITVVDAQTLEKVGVLHPGGVARAADTDGAGKLFLLVKGNVTVVDTKSLQMTTLTLRAKHNDNFEGCHGGHSLKYDATDKRILLGCRDAMLAVDSATGEVVATASSCAQPRAGAFDPTSKLIFEVCGTGVISIIRHVAPDYYSLVDTIKIPIEFSDEGPTVAIDENTHRLFVPAMDSDVLVPDFKVVYKWETARILVIDP